jgi:uncharacterized protein YjbI with pentapeptide repeats
MDDSVSQPASPPDAGASAASLALHAELLASAAASGGEATLAGRDLRGIALLATPARITFRDCDLRDADLSAASGLSIHSFPGSRLGGARLPQGVPDDFRNTNLRELASSTTQQFVTLMVAALFACITVETTTYPALLTDKGGLKLPLVGTELSVVPFFMITPVILLLLFIYFQLHLQQLWEQIARLPREFPSGLSRGEYLPPWMLLSLADWWDPAPGVTTPAYVHRARFVVSFILTWAVIPATLLLFWWRYLPRMHATGNDFLGAVLMVSLAVGVYHFGLTRSTIRRATPIARHGRARVLHLVRRPGVIALAVLSLLLGYVTRGVYQGVRPDVLERVRERLPDRIEGYSRVHPVILVPTVLGALGIYPEPRLEQAQLSTAPAGWEGTDETLASVQGARLMSRRLKSARATEAFLARADLRKAVFSEADLSRADLRGVNARGAWFGWTTLHGTNFRRASLEGAGFRGASIDSADFRHATFTNNEFEAARIERSQFDSANLRQVAWTNADLGHELSFRGADLTGAGLSGGRLCGSDFTGATLAEARLSEADLRGSRFRGTDLTQTDLMQANLEGADLRGAFSGDGWPARVRTARNWPLAFYDSAAYALLGLRLDGPGASSMDSLKLAETDFTGARLSHARFRGSVLTGANFTNADLRMAVFSGADLSGATLNGADLSRTRFRGARGLSTAQVRMGRNWWQAYYDPPFARRLGLTEEGMGRNHPLPPNTALVNADLRRANLRAQDMSRMRFDGALLHRVSASEGIFAGASMRNVDLSAATLTRANLRGADLSGANLSSARLNGADLRDADLTGAVLMGTDLRGANLAGVRGLPRANVRLARIDSVAGLTWVQRARLLARGAVREIGEIEWRHRRRARSATSASDVCEDQFDRYTAAIRSEIIGESQRSTTARGGG